MGVTFSIHMRILAVVPVVAFVQATIARDREASFSAGLRGHSHDAALMKAQRGLSCNPSIVCPSPHSAAL